ncbi:hypothetical protein BJY01DRAFT_264435 [Aspergillus pseudoustus]|uniref:Amine oxidase n=1 Tax=Aspergillus pseudoustus TaxID=1810923 RepID=A0ABR4JS90_9EURO
MPQTVQTVDLAHTSGLYYGPATISSGRVLHISGQPGNTKDAHVPSDYESQIHLCLFNLRKLIIAAGADIKDIAKLNVYIVDYDAKNRKHARPIQRFFGKHRPAQTLVPVPKLAVPEWLIEIDAVVALPDQPSAPMLPAVAECVDVVIIGGGLAGLTAAHEVIRAGLSCIVLEARDRVGGKTWSLPTADGKGTIDVGAAWINDTNQSRIYALAKRYGAEVIVQNTTGTAVLEDFDGSVKPFPYGELQDFGEATTKSVAEIRDMCEADCQAVDTWLPKDTTLDSLTFEAYLRSRGATKTAIGTATVWTRAMLGLEPSEVSALYFLNYCKSGGGLLQMRSDRKDGGQYLRIRGGTQTFAKGLAASLPPGIVRLESAVQTIVQVNDGRSVKVQSNGIVYSARKVISTIPGPALKNITFYPPLPPVKRAWSESLYYGYYTKAMMEFKKPFWVERGFCGLAQSFIGPAGVIRDSSIPQDKQYVLTCFMGGDPGRVWAGLSTPEREEALLKQLSKLYGVSTLEEQFIRMTAYEWVHDEFAGLGCPCTSLPPGVLDSLGGDGLRAPTGNLHFAGTETAGEWKGYMEGAVRSGERAASEVVGELKGPVTARL